jgi:hypothetical protein
VSGGVLCFSIKANDSALVIRDANGQNVYFQSDIHTVAFPLQFPAPQPVHRLSDDPALVRTIGG